MGIIPNLGFLKLDSSGFVILVLSANCAVRRILYQMSSKKHSNAAGQSSRGSASKGRMQLTSYLWKKNWNAVEKLWNFFSGDLYEPCTSIKLDFWALPSTNLKYLGYHLSSQWVGKSGNYIFLAFWLSKASFQLGNSVNWLLSQVPLYPEHRITTLPCLDFAQLSFSVCNDFLNSGTRSMCLIVTKRASKRDLN